MEIVIVVPAEKDRSSIESWALQSGHLTIMLKDACCLSEYLTLRQVQVIIANDQLISFERLRQWRERIPEIDWIAVTDEPSFTWAQEAMLAGVTGFCALPVTPEHMNAMLDLVKKQRLYRLQAMLGMEQGTGSIDLSKPIESALEYITQHLSERLTLRVVSREVYLSPSHFSRLFVQKVGIHFNDYVLSRRIETAKTLLTETRLPIELIAMKTGFCSAPYFSQTFKRLTGKTPRTYRYSSGESVESVRQS
jgi:YesN/AraC family two-component response regulator